MVFPCNRYISWPWLPPRLTLRRAKYPVLRCSEIISPNAFSGNIPWPHSSMGQSAGRPKLHWGPRRGGRRSTETLPDSGYGYVLSQRLVHLFRRRAYPSNVHGELQVPSASSRWMRLPDQAFVFAIGHASIHRLMMAGWLIPQGPRQERYGPTGPDPLHR